MGQRVVVIGAGIVGASIAWHLTASGASVTVVDADAAGGLATAASFAWINASWGNADFYVHFRRRAMQSWEVLSKALPQMLYSRCGGLLWDLSPDRLEAFERDHRALGYRLRWVDTQEARRIEPALIEPPAMALYAPDEAMVEPAIAARALIHDAKSRGAEMIAGKAVLSLLTRGDRVVGIRLSDGTNILADQVVIAAGAATASLVSSVGIGLKLHAPPGLIAHSSRADQKLVNGLVLSPDFHVRQTAEGRLIAGADFGGGDPGEDAEGMAATLLAKVRASIAGSEDLVLDFATVGERPRPLDGFPIIGRPGGIEGLTTAVMHSGVTLAPLVGEIIAEEIVHGRRDPELLPYDPNRPAVCGV